MTLFSFKRFIAMVDKEFVQMRRDRLTFAMLIGIPLIQLILFGYAINSDPRHLPTAVLSADNSPFSRSIVTGMQTSTFFNITSFPKTRAEATDLIRKGVVQFVVTIPEQFGRDILRGDRPVLLLEADATDPMATGNAAGSFPEIVRRALAKELKGTATNLNQGLSPVDIRIHNDYNPEAISQYNIVPGLMGVILTMTLVMITSLAITRESERGTMEHLLATPGQTSRSHAGKNRSLYLCRLHPDNTHCIGCKTSVRCANAWKCSLGVCPSPCSLLGPTSPLASPFQPSQGISSKLFKCRYFSSCHHFFFLDSCFLSEECRNGPKSLDQSCR